MGVFYAQIYHSNSMSWDLCRRFWRFLPPFLAAFAPRGPLLCTHQLWWGTHVKRRQFGNLPSRTASLLLLCLHDISGLRNWSPSASLFFPTDLKSTMAFFQQSRGLRGGLPIHQSFVTWAWSSAYITLYPAISLVGIHGLGALLLTLFCLFLSLMVSRLPFHSAVPSWGAISSSDNNPANQFHWGRNHPPSPDSMYTSRLVWTTPYLCYWSMTVWFDVQRRRWPRLPRITIRSDVGSWTRSEW